MTDKDSTDNGVPDCGFGRQDAGLNCNSGPSRGSGPSCDSEASRGTASDADFRAQLAGFSLTTAEILYHMPDYPALLQSYIWQEYDLAPRFPKLKGFLDFWTAKLDGKLFKVTVAHSALIRPAELRLIGSEFRVH